MNYKICATSFYAYNVKFQLLLFYYNVWRTLDGDWHEEPVTLNREIRMNCGFSWFRFSSCERTQNPKVLFCLICLWRQKHSQMLRFQYFQTEVAPFDGK